MGSLGEVPSKAQPATLTSVAAEISELSAKFTKFLEENSLAAPTFDASSPKSYEGLTVDAFMTRQLLIDRINDMWYLTQGPSESIFNYVHSTIPDAAAMNVLNYFDFWSAVPVDGTASLAEIAKHTGLPEEVVERVLNHATTLRLFSFADDGQGQTTPGGGGVRVRHSARSAAMAQSEGLRALVSTVLDEAGAPLMVLHEALDRHSRGRARLTQDPAQTSFAHLHSKGSSDGGDGGGPRYANPWDMLENDGEGGRKGWRHANFVRFMRYLRGIFGFDAVVAAALDWAALGPGARVVDVGGSAGHDAAALARRFPNLRVTVQDLPRVGPVFAEALGASDLVAEGRVAFMAHDFFQPQPVAGADVVLLKMILHDWCDEDSVRILRALVPALKPGARVVLIEYMGGGDEAAQAELPRSVRTMGTATDLRLMALFNARERPVGAWKGLLAAADERFRIASVKANPGEFFAVIEAVWTP